MALTQKAKLQEAFIFAQRIKNRASDLMFYCKDYGLSEGKVIAKEIDDLCQEFIKKLK